MEQKVDIVVSGTVFCDLVFENIEHLPEAGREFFADGLTISPGGGFSTSVWLSHLGCSVAHIDDIGTDLFSLEVKRYMKDSHVNMSYMIERDDSLPKVTAILPHEGDRAMVTYVKPSPSWDVCDYFPEHFRHLHFCGLDYLENASSLAVKKAEYGITVSLDIGWESAELPLEAFIKKSEGVDIFMPNADEAMALTNQKTVEEALEVLKPYFKIMIITCGQRGVYGYYKGERYHVSALDLPVVDTTGAGDAFVAGFLSSWLSGAPFRDSLREGNIIGGISTLESGGCHTLPPLEAIAVYRTDFLKEGD